MKIILIGYGNVGKEMHKVLQENFVPVNFIFKSDGIYDAQLEKIDELSNFTKYFDIETFIFISTPSSDKGEIVENYYIKALEAGSKIITCEKAFLAYNWQKILPYLKQIKYSATVGGNSGILPAVSNFPEKITEISAVVNGTLNYISEDLINDIPHEKIYEELMIHGFAEPGAKNFAEVIELELKDVLYKTAILANHSKIFEKVVTPADVILQSKIEHARALVLINEKEILAGFIPVVEDSWFPHGVNNILYINNQKMAEGPGAGARATAERMFKDYQESDMQL